MLVSKSVHKCLAGSTCGLAEKGGPSSCSNQTHFTVVAPQYNKRVLENTWQKTTGEEEEAGASPAGVDE